MISSELENRIGKLEEKIIALEKQCQMLMSAYTILIEEYSKVENNLSRLSKNLELSVTPMVSPLHLIELQDKNAKQSRSKLDLLLEKAVNGVFKDYESQFEG